MEKKKKSFNILLFGLISQVVTLSIGIILPKLLIVSYGSEVNGLLSSVKQIFVYVALLEAGIGTAALQALYEPVATDNKKNISQIMAATDRYYKRTGILYGVAVIVLAITYPLLIETSIETYIIIAIILLQGFSGVIKYFFQGKLVILLRVDGKSYITTNATTIVTIAAHIAQIVLIYIGFDIVAVQSAYFIINLFQMIYIVYYIKKNYKWLDLKEKPNYNALDQSKFVVLHQISGLIFNNTDILILTYFCGLKVVSVYALYNLIFSCVSNIIDTLCSSVEFVLGQAFNSNRNHFLRLQEVYETYYIGISFCFFTITLVMFPSFITIYATGITDINYVDVLLPYLFATVNVLMYARRTSSQIINFAGHFQQTQWRSVIESVINIVITLIMVNIFGIYGVLMGTIAALIYRTNDIIIYANWNILGRNPWNTYRRWFQNTAIMFLCVTTLNQILPTINGYIEWGLNAIWISILCFCIYIIVDSYFDKESYTVAKRICLEVVRKKLKLKMNEEI